MVTLGGIPTRPPDDRLLALVPRLPPTAWTHGHGGHLAQLRRRAAGRSVCHLPDALALEAVDRAASSGITLFDTAPLYGRGLSEHRIGTALRGRPRDAFVLSTKVGRLYAPAPADVQRPEGYAGGLPFEGRFDYSYDGALRSIEHSLLRLGLASIDIALIHDIDPWTHGDDYPRRFAEALAGAYRALDDLRSQKVIGAVGIGVNDAAVCARMAREADIDCVMLAGRYSLLEQGALDEFLPLAAQRGIGVMLGGVFNSGSSPRARVRARTTTTGPRPRTYWSACAASSGSATPTACRCRTPRSASRSAIPPSPRWCWGRSRPTRWTAISQRSTRKFPPRCGATS